jgi:hypothetical protein
MVTHFLSSFPALLHKPRSSSPPCQERLYGRRGIWRAIEPLCPWKSGRPPDNTILSPSEINCINERQESNIKPECQRKTGCEEDWCFFISYHSFPFLFIYVFLFFSFVPSPLLFSPFLFLSFSYFFLQFSYSLLIIFIFLLSSIHSVIFLYFVPYFLLYYTLFCLFPEGFPFISLITTRCSSSRIWSKYHRLQVHMLMTLDQHQSCVKHGTRAKGPPVFISVHL